MGLGIALGLGCGFRFLLCLGGGILARHCLGFGRLFGFGLGVAFGLQPGFGGGLGFFLGILLCLCLGVRCRLELRGGLFFGLGGCLTLGFRAARLRLRGSCGGLFLKGGGSQPLGDSTNLGRRYRFELVGVGGGRRNCRRGFCRVALQASFHRLHRRRGAARLEEMAQVALLLLEQARPLGRSLRLHRGRAHRKSADAGEQAQRLREKPWIHLIDLRSRAGC